MEDEDFDPAADLPLGEKGKRSQPPCIIPASELFRNGEAKEVGISHGGKIYRLRITKAGKLILTK
ncbi:hemin uptake protein HemP [Jiella marina]|uniref:hemin uptake protein HemP n=1 Tax=Jiella sp. LLJ827 TaxID=2917712 RepID=UPI002100BFD1|nr:hemin uptake protein HemP [Jiella sp. LLJ827]MCQ0987376.1 hemin uptake protein HemP [Jiella sp. LLJ827]